MEKKLNTIIWIIMCLLLSHCGNMESINGSSNASNDGSRNDGNIIDIEMVSLGKAQYNQHCASCHGPLEFSTIKDVDVSQIEFAFANVAMMAFTQNIDVSKEAIAAALASESMPELVVGEARFQCDPGVARGQTQTASRRLTQFEIKQSIRQVFGETVFAATESTLENWPAEAFTETYEEFQPEMDGPLFNSWQNALALFSKKITEDQNLRKSFLPKCLFNEFDNFDFTDQTCVSNFVDNIGLKIMRRPLTQDQKSLFMGILNSNESFHTYHRHRLEALITAMLMSPEFVTHFSVLQSDNGTMGKVDSYTIANRMSYRLTGSSPDTALMQAAMQGNLGTLSERKSQASRLVKSSAARRFGRNLFYHILHLNKVSEPSSTYGQELGVSTNGLKQAMIDEALDFSESLVFDQEASFNEIMTTQNAFPKTQNSAEIFGNRVSSGINDPINSTKNHRGLYMRPALLLGPEPRTSPIKRGIFITRRVLCNEIPEPDPAALEQAEKIADELDLHMLTARQEAEAVTGAASCQICHQHINAQGFFMEQFGAFGDLRTTEKIFDDNGNVIKELAINTKVDDLVLDGQKTSINGGLDFVEKVSQSSQGQACMAQNIYRYTEYKQESEADHCRLSEVENQIRSDQPVIEALIENATSEDLLWEKTN